MNLNSKGLNLIIIIILVLLSVGYLWYITIPRQVPSSKVVVVPADVLDSETVAGIKSSPFYGNIPLGAGGQEKGKPDPFANP